jgi:hypothetical protein
VYSAVVTSAVRLSFIPALLKDPDVSMAMGIPMSWSVVEPAVGILASSGPAIRTLFRALFSKLEENSYSSGAPPSTLRSRNGHIQIGAMEGQKTRNSGNGSKDYHVEPTGPNQISKTTELEVSYSPKEYGS